MCSALLIWQMSSGSKSITFSLTKLMYVHVLVITPPSRDGAYIICIQVPDHERGCYKYACTAHLLLSSHLFSLSYTATSLIYTYTSPSSLISPVLSLLYSHLTYIYIYLTFFSHLTCSLSPIQPPHLYIHIPHLLLSSHLFSLSYTATSLIGERERAYLVVQTARFFCLYIYIRR